MAQNYLERTSTQRSLLSRFVRVRQQLENFESVTFVFGNEIIKALEEYPNMALALYVGLRTIDSGACTFNTKYATDVFRELRLE